MTKELTPFGADVKKALIDKRMSQVELAGLLGVKKQYITALLAGRTAGTKYIPRICEILGLDEKDYPKAA